MPLGMKRDELRAIAQAKIEDAKILLANGRYSNAYYLAGYAVEIGLKACIASQFIADVIPDKTFVNDIYRHKLKDLVGSAGLSRSLKDREDKDPNFAINWALVAQWTPEIRYQAVDPMSAQGMVAAITDTKSGVLEWIKAHW